MKFVASSEEINSDDYNEDEWENLNDIETVLGSFGIALRDSAGTFKNVDDVIAEIGENWDTYNSVQQSAISTAVAGTRQREVFQATMENWDSVQKAAQLAADSQGTAAKKMQAYTDSIEANQKKITAAIEKLALSLNIEGIMKKFYSVIADVVENIGLLSTAVIGYLSLFKGQSMYNSLFGGGKVGTNLIYGLSNMGMRNSNGANSTIFSAFKNGMQGWRSDVAAGLTESKIYSNTQKVQKTRGFKNLNASNQAIVTNATQFNSRGINEKVADRMYGNYMTALAEGTATEEELTIKKKAAIASLTYVAAADDAETFITNNLSEEERAKIREEVKAKAATQALTEAEIEAEIKTREVSSAMNKQIAALKSSGNIKNVAGMYGSGKVKEEDVKKYALSGAFSTAGMIGGGLMGSALGEQIGGSTGAMVGMMGLGAIGQNLGNLPKTAEGFKNLFASIPKNGSALTKLSAGFKALPTSMLAVEGAMSGLAAAGVMAAAAIAFVILKMKEKQKEDRQEAYETSKEKYDTQASAAAEYDESRYAELAEGVDKYGRNLTLTNEEYEEFVEMSNNLAAAFPELITYTDEAGNSFLNLGDAANEMTDAIDAAVAASKRKRDMDLLETREDQVKEDKKQKKKLDNQLNTVDELIENGTTENTDAAISMLKKAGLDEDDYTVTVGEGKGDTGSIVVDRSDPEVINKLEQFQGTVNSQLSTLNQSYVDFAEAALRIKYGYDENGEAYYDQWSDEKKAMVQNAVQYIDYNAEDYEAQVYALGDLVNGYGETMESYEEAYGGDNGNPIDYHNSRSDILAYFMGDDVFGSDASKWSAAQKGFMESNGYSVNDDGTVTDTRDTVGNIIGMTDKNGVVIDEDTVKSWDLGRFTNAEVDSILEQINNGRFTNTSTAEDMEAWMNANIVGGESVEALQEKAKNAETAFDVEAYKKLVAEKTTAGEEVTMEDIMELAPGASNEVIEKATKEAQEYQAARTQEAANSLATAATETSKSADKTSEASETTTTAAQAQEEAAEDTINDINNVEKTEAAEGGTKPSLESTNESAVKAAEEGTNTAEAVNGEASRNVEDRVANKEMEEGAEAFFKSRGITGNAGEGYKVNKKAAESKQEQNATDEKFKDNEEYQAAKKGWEEYTEAVKEAEAADKELAEAQKDVTSTTKKGSKEEKKATAAEDKSVKAKKKKKKATEDLNKVIDKGTKKKKKSNKEDAKDDKEDSKAIKNQNKLAVSSSKVASAIAKGYKKVKNSISNAVTNSEDQLNQMGESVADTYEDSKTAIQEAMVSTDLNQYMDWDSMDENANGIIDSWSELSSVFEQLQTDISLVTDAMEEQNNQGYLSMQTALELLSANEDYIDVLEVKDGKFQLAADAEETMMQKEMQAIKQNIQQTIAEKQAKLETINAILKKNSASEAEIAELNGTTNATNDLTTGNDNVANSSYNSAAGMASASAAAIDLANSYAQAAEAASSLNRAENGSTGETSKTYSQTTTAANDYGSANSNVSSNNVDTSKQEETLTADQRKDLEQQAKDLENEIKDYQAFADSLDSVEGWTEAYSPSDSSGSGGSGGSGSGDDYSKLDRIKDILSSINKEYQQMVSYNDKIAAGHNIDLSYYKKKRKYLKAEMKALKSQMKTDKKQTDKSDYYQDIQDYQEAKMELANLDDEKIQDRLDLMEARKELTGVVTDMMLREYKILIKTADTEEERLEYEKKLADAKKEQLETQQSILQAVRDTLSAEAVMAAAYSGNSNLTNSGINNSKSTNYEGLKTVKVKNGRNGKYVEAADTAANEKAIETINALRSGTKKIKVKKRDKNGNVVKKNGKVQYKYVKASSVMVGVDSSGHIVYGASTSATGAYTALAKKLATANQNSGSSLYPTATIKDSWGGKHTYIATPYNKKMAKKINKLKKTHWVYIGVDDGGELHYSSKKKSSSKNKTTVAKAKKKAKTTTKSNINKIVNAANSIKTGTGEDEEDVSASAASIKAVKKDINDNYVMANYIYGNTTAELAKATKESKELLIEEAAIVHEKWAQATAEDEKAEYAKEYQELITEINTLEADQAQTLLDMYDTLGYINEAYIELIRTQLNSSSSLQEQWEYQEKLNEAIKEEREITKNTLDYRLELLDALLEYQSYTPNSDKYKSYVAQEKAILQQELDDALKNANEYRKMAYENYYQANKEQGMSTAEAEKQAWADSENDESYQEQMQAYIEIYQKLGELILKEFEDKADEIQRKLDKMEEERSDAWRTSWSKTGKIEETAISKIEDYYEDIIELNQSIKTEALAALEDVDKLTDEQVQEIVDVRLANYKYENSNEGVNRPEGISLSYGMH